MMISNSVRSPTVREGYPAKLPSLTRGFLTLHWINETISQ